MVKLNQICTIGRKIMNSYIIIICLIACIGAVATVFFKKDYSLLQKVNSAVYSLTTGAFLLCCNYILIYFKSVYGISGSYMNTLITVLSVSSFIGFILTIILSFKRNLSVSRIYSLLMLVVTVAFTINIFYSNPAYKFMAVVIIVLALLNIVMVTDSTEDLKSKPSISIYFTVNIINCIFWSVSLGMFIKKLSTAGDLSVILLAIGIIVAFIGTIVGFINFKRN